MSNNNCQNNLKKILDKKGIDRPTADRLNELGISLTKFKRLYNNTACMTADELLTIAEWLEVDPYDLKVRNKKPRKEGCRG